MLSVLFCLLSTVYATKLRSWLGPGSFMEGGLPSARADHGFSSTDEDTIYVFGGYGASGENERLYSNLAIHIFDYPIAMLIMILILRSFDFLMIAFLAGMHTTKTSVCESGVVF